MFFKRHILFIVFAHAFGGMRRKTKILSAATRNSALRPQNELDNDYTVNTAWCLVTDSVVALELWSDSSLLQKLEDVTRHASKCRCSLLEPGVLSILDQFVWKAYENYILGHPLPWQLSIIIQINTIDALIHNDHTLGVSDLWQRETAMSPFSNERSYQQRMPPLCPLSLRPTELQRRVPHRAWIDIFPIPQMRRNILQEYNRVDTDELCADLLDISPGLEDKPNLIVWGDVANPGSWEASTRFWRKCGWVLLGCSGILDTTKY
jgi:hypothetical protein